MRAERLGSLLLCTLAAAAPAQAQRQVFATTTTYEIEGGASHRSMDAPYIGTLDQYTIHSDAVARTDGRYVYVINRLFADNVLVLDPANSFAVVRQFSVASTGLNPRDLVTVGASRAYVTLYESNSILVCNPLTGAKLGVIDLSAFADADGLVEMDQMVRVGDRVFVALQQLDRRVVPWAATGLSRLVVIDTTTDQIVDVDPQAPGVQAVALGAQNPYWRLRFDGRMGRLLMVASGSYLARDGGIEIVNPFTLRSEGLLVSEAALAGELLDFAVVDETMGWAIVNDAQFNTCLVRFDPSTGTRTDTVLCSNGFLLSDLELSLDGRVFVSDRKASAPGVRIYDAHTAASLAGPLSMGLPPFDLLLIEGVPTSSAPPFASAPRLSAAPNPFNPRVEIRLRDATLAAGAWIEVVDARGRRVRTLTGGRPEGESTLVWTWDGHDDAGEALASGVYHARVPGVAADAVTLTLVR